MPRSGFATLQTADLSPPATSTSGQSSTSRLATSEGMRNAISSLASAAGLSRSDLPDGVTSDRFGPDHVHASPSVPPADNGALQTNATSGRRGSISSASIALQRSLESKLLTRSLGSTSHSMTWRASVTPAQRRICRLRASAHRKIAPGSGSWPTPRAAGGKAGPDYAKATRSKTGLSLPTVLGGMPNPTWLAWLMGYPEQWINAAPSVTPSSPKSRRRSSEHLQKSEPN